MKGGDNLSGDRKSVSALKSGQLSEEKLDLAVERFLTAIFKIIDNKKTLSMTRIPNIAYIHNFALTDLRSQINFHKFYIRTNWNN